LTAERGHSGTASRRAGKGCAGKIRNIFSQSRGPADSQLIFSFLKRIDVRLCVRRQVLWNIPFNSGPAEDNIRGGAVGNTYADLFCQLNGGKTSTGDSPYSAEMRSANFSTKLYKFIYNIKSFNIVHSNIYDGIDTLGIAVSAKNSGRLRGRETSLYEQ